LGATVELEQLLEPLRGRPQATAVVCDIDGTLAPIVARPEDAAVPARGREVLRRLAKRFALVACLSGRRAAVAREIVGIQELVYIGNHGLEVLEPGAAAAHPDPRLERAPERVRAFAEAALTDELRALGVRLEDKDAIWALHYRGAPDEDAAHAALEGVAREARSAGLVPHWGRLVLEIRPPVAADKGTAITALVERAGLSQALFGGDDTTDLDAFRALRALRESGRLETALCVGIRSPEGPAAIVAEADVIAEGTEGFVELLERLAA
jgi:trehalose 6-phosphate phosphatase